MEDEDVTELNFCLKKLIEHPSISTFINLIELDCCYNSIEHLPPLPETLSILKCETNNLKRLPPLPKLKHLSCYQNKIKKLNLPDTLEELYCASNEIVRLKLPNSLKIVNCSRNKIKTLKIPEGIEELYCSSNKITSLKLPSGLKKLSCSENLIESLELNECLEYLNCERNKLTRLPLNNVINYMNISHNKIDTIPVLPESILSLCIRSTNVYVCFDMKKLDYIYFYDTPLYDKVKSILKVDVTNPELVKGTFERIKQIEGRFKYTYYCVNLKEGLMKWLWKSREKIAMEKYHPDKLVEILKNGYDALDDW